MLAIIRRPAAALAVLMVAGCVNIPPESITVNRKVSDGISVMEQNTTLVIDAWRDMAIALLEWQFDDIYDQAEAKYRSRKSIPANQALTGEQERDVAAFVVLVNQEVRNSIEEQVAAMKKVTRQNANALGSANDSITKLLESAQSVISGRHGLIGDLGQLSPVIAGVSDFVEKAKQTALDNL